MQLFRVSFSVMNDGMKIFWHFCQSLYILHASTVQHSHDNNMLNWPLSLKIHSECLTDSKSICYEKISHDKKTLHDLYSLNSRGKREENSFFYFESPMKTKNENSLYLYLTCYYYDSEFGVVSPSLLITSKGNITDTCGSLRNNSSLKYSIFTL